VSVEALETSVGEERSAWDAKSHPFIKRRFGIGNFARSRSAAFSQAPKARGKTFVTLCSLANMVRTTQRTLAFWQILPDPTTGLLPDPYTWPSFALASDAGPDMVCTDHFLTYARSLNLDTVYDMCHGTKNCGKGTLKESGLWPFMVLMTAAGNCAYGSTLSPPRLQQVRESVSKYFSRRTPSDALFQSFLPFLVDQLGLGVSLGDEHVDQVEINHRMHHF